MTYKLVLADPAYSSWSMRAFLIMEHFGLPHEAQFFAYRNGSMAQQLDFGPAKTVPVLVLPSEQIVTDSLAIAEELASRHPEAGLWPEDPDLRALARSLTAEMHASFGALRNLCPMNLRVAYEGVDVPPELHADLQRVAYLWRTARERSGGPWLAGEYSVADAFYAPVAARILGHSLEVDDETLAYCKQHLGHRGFQAWQRLALEEGEDLAENELAWPRVRWPQA